MNDSSDAKKVFDRAISDYVANSAGHEGEMVTGWVLSLTVKHPNFGSGDGYIVEHSEGMPYHSQLGLLHAALNEKTNVILSQVIKE